MRWSQSPPVAIAVLAVLAVGLLPMLVGMWRATRHDIDDLNQWLPDRAAATQEYHWFLQTVGSGELAVISWPGCSWNDPRVTLLAERLRAERLPGGDSDEPLFDEVLAGSEVMALLAEAPLFLDEHEATERLRGVLVSHDGRATAVVAVLSPQAAIHRNSTLERLQQVTHQTTGVARDDLRLGGPAVTAWAITQQSQKWLGGLIAASVVLSLLLAWAALGSFRLAGLVFTGASYCQGWSVALVDFTGGQMNAVLVMMPCLIQVLAISASVHWLGYYRESLARLPLEQAPAAMLRAGWQPALVASGTTLLGLGSLTLSQIDLVRQFGFHAAVGVGFSFVVLVLYLPAVLRVLPAPPRGAVPPLRVAGQTSCQAGRWRPLAEFVLRRHRPIVLSMLAGLIVFVSGLVWLRPQVRVETLFPADARLLRDLAWLDTTIGPSVPLEVLLRCGPECPLGVADRLLLVERLADALDELPFVGGRLSAATFVPPRPEGLVGRNLWNVRIGHKQNEFRDSGFLIETPDEQLWRLSLRVAPPPDDDYGILLDEVQAVVEPILAEKRAAGVVQLRATYTGIIPVLDHAQHQLLSDFLESFAVGLGLICLAMMLLLRNVSGGILVMLPNLLPMAVVFGSLAWLGQGVDVASMMTATIALGIAVDDSVHYVVNFRRGRAQGLSTDASIHRAYRLCGTAMLQTTLICGLGMAVFLASPFLPTARFSLLMAWLLAMALVGDLVLLPALLKGPCGRFFAAPPPSSAEQLRASQAA